MERLRREGALLRTAKSRAQGRADPVGTSIRSGAAVADRLAAAL